MMSNTDYMKLEIDRQKKSGTNKADTKEKLLSPQNSGKVSTVNLKFKHNLFAFRPENNGEDDVRSDRSNGKVCEENDVGNANTGNDDTKDKGLNEGERNM